MSVCWMKGGRPGPYIEVKLICPLCPTVKGTRDFAFLEKALEL